MKRANRRALRTLIQVIASGGLTALVAAVADGLSPTLAAIAIATGTVAIAWAQNYLEAEGKIPTVLPTPPPGGSAPLVQPR